MYLPSSPDNTRRVWKGRFVNVARTGRTQDVECGKNARYIQEDGCFCQIST